MSKFTTKIPETNDEIKTCHSIREYVLKESLADEGIELKHYDSNHPVHHAPNISLIFIYDDKIIGQVRLDKQFEHIKFKENEMRVALFGISADFQSKGLGSKFFEGVKNWCQENKINTLYTNSRLSSHSFWTKMGFIDKPWDKELDCETEIQMVLHL